MTNPATLTAVSRSLVALVALIGLLHGGCCQPICAARAPAAVGLIDRTEPLSLTRPPEPTAWREIGKSVEGRPLRVRTIGHGPRKILWIGGVHGDEQEGRVATARLPGAFAAVPFLGERVTLTILEDGNPDGTARGTRANATGVDLNRNFPAQNYVSGRKRFGKQALSQPEAKAIYDLILEVDPDLTFAIHSWSGDHFINYDGPARRDARLFAALSGYRVRGSDTFHATPGSLGSWLGVDRGKALLTLEYRKGRDPDAAWEETKRAILAVVYGYFDD